MSTSRMRRGVTTGAAVLLVALLAPAAAAGGTGAAPAAHPVRSGSTLSAVDRVADFYGVYIDVLHDSGHGRLSASLRQHYLTASFRRALVRWEAVHHQDGMLRTKDVPVQWSVSYNGSGAGHCWNLVTLTWTNPGGPVRHTHLLVQSDLASKLISGVKTVK